MPMTDVTMVTVPMSIAELMDNVFGRMVKIFVFVDLELKVIKKELLRALISTNVVKKRIVVINGHNVKIPLEVIFVNVVLAGRVMVIKHVAKGPIANALTVATVVLLVNVKPMTDGGIISPVNADRAMNWMVKTASKSMNARKTLMSVTKMHNVSTKTVLIHVNV